MRFLLLLILLLGGRSSFAQSSDLPGLSGGGRRWVALLIEDHAGMREAVWDSAFDGTNQVGPFKNDHRYALRTSPSSGLVDLGCWDQAWPNGQGWRAGADVATGTRTSDGLGVVISIGGKKTWLPIVAPYAGKGAPTGTFRGAYLNWLLLNRGTTPAIPKETRWQRLQRGSMEIVRELLTRAGGAPEYRVVGVGTSGRLLIPPGEGLPAGVNAVGRMEPTNFGAMEGALQRAYETVKNLKTLGGCQPGIVLAISDGVALSGACAGSVAYEKHSKYPSMQALASLIPATAQAALWTWSVDGSKVWSQDLSRRGMGLTFHGDAVTALASAIDAWMKGLSLPPQLQLSWNQPTLTRFPEVLLTIAVNRPISVATLNGAPVVLTGLETQVPITLNEGLNTFAVVVQDACGGRTETSTSITLDSIPPKITLTSPLPSLISATRLGIRGMVDDPAALLTLNGQSVALDAQGNFTLEVPLVEGPNAFHFAATDLAGNVGRLAGATIRDTIPPVVLIDFPTEGLISNEHAIVVKGRVDDPTALLRIGNQSLSPDSKGFFQLALNPGEGAQLLVVLATDPAGNTGHATRSFTLDWTPPVLTWMDPTPGEGALVSKVPVSALATVSESATVTFNGQALALESRPMDAQGSAPFQVKSTQSPQEGPVVWMLEAKDRAGNTSRIQRSFELGLSVPQVFIESPLEGFQTQASNGSLMGRVEAPAFVKPLSLTLNGSSVAVGTDGRFALPVTLQEGANPFQVQATSRFGHKGESSRILRRYSGSFLIEILRPLDGFATPLTQVDVRGRVDRVGVQVTVNGIPAVMDSDRLLFTATVPLQSGLNTLKAIGTDQAGNTASASVRVQCVPASGDPKATYRWDLPLNGSTSKTRLVPVIGQATLPGVVSAFVNGVRTDLSGVGTDGRFKGEVRLDAKGRNTLLLEVRTLAGETFTERRDVIFAPDLPKLKLVAPESARPGDRIQIQVGPEPGSRIKSADLRWNGGFLARVTDPFAPVSAQVPADAAIDSQIPVEATGIDEEGEQITARTSVRVYAQGALLAQAFDDSKGLPLKEGSALIEAGESRPLDDAGQAALATALPQNWVQFRKDGFVPVWRSAALQVGVVQSLMDGRPTPMADFRTGSGAAFHETYAQGALELDFPSGALQGEGTLSLTPLSTQGLPGLLPKGWSAVSAWWLEARNLQLQAPGGTAKVALPSAALPADARFHWVRWDSIQHVWMVLSANLTTSELQQLPVPTVGGFAVVLGDPGATAPPVPVAGSPLPAFNGITWRTDIKAVGNQAPVLLPTVDAIRGARILATLSLDFEGKAPIASGEPIQAEVIESYVLVDERLIEPEIYSQDVVAARWVLGVDAQGVPTLRGGGDGLAIDMPVRMSRTLGETELVEGQIVVAFYHDGVRLVQGGSDLLGAGGGSLSQDGLTVSFAPGSLSGTTLVQIHSDSGDLSLIWPELSAQGRIAKSFQLSVVGRFGPGLGMQFEDLGDVPEGILPLLVQRRVVQGERVVVVVGALQKQGAIWALSTPVGGTPILEGGSFAVLVPDKGWDWISGTVRLPTAVAAPLVKRLGAKALLHARPKSQSLTDGFVGVQDALVGAGFLRAASSAEGQFAVPAFRTSGPLTLQGERRDLGLSGSLSTTVPSQGNLLDLSTVPFQVTAVIPSEGAEISVGAVLEVLTSTPMDPQALAGVRLFRLSGAAASIQPTLLQKAKPSTPKKAKAGTEKPKPTAKKSKQPKSNSKKANSKAQKSALSLDAGEVEIPLGRSLSLDGRSLLLTPGLALDPGASFQLRIEGLKSLSGELHPTLARNFKVQTTPSYPDIDFSRFKLTYPDAQLNLTVTVPQGACPPWAVVEVDATEMGSSGTGVMPPAGDMVFHLKAGLGERLPVTINLPDGRVQRGILSRYVSTDGRTTLSQDGGRVEGPGGLALVIPKDGLTGVAEIQIEVLKDAPAVAEGMLSEGEKLIPGLQIRIQGPGELVQMPIVEAPESVLPAGADTVSKPTYFGNGPVSILAQGRKTLPDGTEDEFLQLIDTAELLDTSSGRKLVGLGGLRLPGNEEVQSKIAFAKQGLAAPAKQGLVAPAAIAPAIGAVNADCSQNLKGVDVPKWDQSGAGTNIFSALLKLNFLSYPALQTDYRYQAGRVVRNWNVHPGPPACSTPSADCYAPLPGAEVYRRVAQDGGSLGRGRILAATDACGRYLIMGVPYYNPDTINQPEYLATYQAVDPRTGATSQDPTPKPTAEGLGHRNTNRDFWIVIASLINELDPTLKPPRIEAQMLDGDGRAQTIFHVGQTGKLHLSLVQDSQPVAQMKLTGGLEQSLDGSFPKDIPVTFAQEGVWRVDFEAWSIKQIKVTGALEVVVTPYADLGPSLPGKPRITAKSPEPDAKDVTPSEVVKLTFNEPVRGARSGSFELKLLEGTQERAIPFRVLADGQEVTDQLKLVQQVWLVPDQRFPLGAKVKVLVTNGIQDQDFEALDAVNWTFTVRGADLVGATQSGTLMDMVAFKTKLYAVEKLGESLLDPSWDGAGKPIQAIRIFDVGDPSQPKAGALFGGHGSILGPDGHTLALNPYYLEAEVKRADLILKDGSGTDIPVEPFFRQEIRAIRVGPGVRINGVSRDVLLVGTYPRTPVMGNTIQIYNNPEGNQGQYLNNSTLWVFDITGDTDSFGPNQAPKLLMSTTIGKTTGGLSIAGLPAGLGSAGGMLGVMWRLEGMKILDGDKWRSAFTADAQSLGITEAALARKSRQHWGYYPTGGSVIATSDISRQHYEWPGNAWMAHGVIAEDDAGLPVGFATLGQLGKLVHIDPKTGTGEAMVAYMGEASDPWDQRVKDLSEKVNNERTFKVEVLRGSWQGPDGSESGLLVLAVTDKHFWVAKAVWTEDKPFELIPLAKATLPEGWASVDLPWTKTAIATDPEKMLVAVKVGDKLYAFDLRNLVPSGTNPMVLVPMYVGTANGPLALEKGILYSGDTPLKSLTARNLDGVRIVPTLGIPMLVDANQFFAGAFYDYNKSVLGDYNPPPQPQMPERLVYALTKMQGTNGGYPALRHYYPDLGEMHISGIVDTKDPKQFLEMTQPTNGTPSTWFMEAEAKLMDGDSEVPNAVKIEGLTLSGGQRLVAGNGTIQSKIFGDGDQAKFELANPERMSGTGDSAGVPVQTKFAYAPFKFFIQPEVLLRMDQALRLDFKERYRVVVEMKLYKDQAHWAQGTPETSLKTFEFAVKFNSNTRLFDVLRGGAWYFDPVVASNDPSDTAKNPFTAEWLKRLVDANGESIPFSDILRTRLSLTPGTLIAKGTKVNGIEFSTDVVANHENALAWIGLDVVQQLNDTAMPKLRRQVFEDNRWHRMVPLEQRFRPVFQEAPRDAQGRIDTTRAADAMGAFGYRMAHVVNAMQAFTEEEAGKGRDLNNPRPEIWGWDPTLQQGDRDTEGNPVLGRVMPILNQRLKNGQDYNPGNVLVNYLVAYPRIRTITPTMDGNGLYPINTILTRDLVVGPMGLSAAGFESQRKAIDDCIESFKLLSSPSTASGQKEIREKVPELSARLASALMSQRVITNQILTGSGQGAFFNKGLGMLQLGMQESWFPMAMDDQEPVYIPGGEKNSHLYVWVQKPQSMDYDTDPGFNLDMREGVLNHLLKHMESKRLDIYVNGVNNSIEEVEIAANHLQQKVDDLEGLATESKDSPKRTPVLVVYNHSAKKYYGGADQRDIVDLGECARLKRFTAMPYAKTAEPDAVRLIGMVKAAIDTLWGSPYQAQFYQTKLAAGMPRKVWYWPGEDAEPELKDFVLDVLTKPPVQVTNGSWVEYVQSVSMAPCITGRIDQDFPVDSFGKTEGQIRTERYRNFLKQNEAFKPVASAELQRLRKELESIKVTLHSHSQGAIIAAIAQTRLGTIERTRTRTAEEVQNQVPITLDVASQIRLVSYGGGANMLDWGPNRYYRSYAHHVNDKDAVAWIVGMWDPFQGNMSLGAPFIRPALLAGAVFAPGQMLWIRKAAQGSLIGAVMNDPFNPHIDKLISGPTADEKSRWAAGDHLVIFHASEANTVNVEEHSFPDGYKCTIGKEALVDQYPRIEWDTTTTTGLARWFWMHENPNVKKGEKACLYQR